MQRKLIYAESVLHFVCVEKVYNLQASSLPSVHSWVPSQRSEERIHCPLLHRNPPLPQEATHWNHGSINHPNTYVWYNSMFHITIQNLIQRKYTCPPNILQLISSLPSEHPPLNPLHRKEEETHWPLAHWNWVELQPVDIIMMWSLIFTCVESTLNH